MRLDLILTMRNVYINSKLKQLTNLIAAAEAPNLKIPSHGKITNTVPISMRTVISYTMKRSLTLVESETKK